MVARIYKIQGSPTQSGNLKTKWCLEFIPQKKFIDRQMGWLASADTMSEVKIEFEDMDSAIAFAQQNNYKYELITSAKNKVIKKSYADNFI